MSEELGHASEPMFKTVPLLPVLWACPKSVSARYLRAELATAQILGTARPDLPTAARTASAVPAIAKNPGTTRPELPRLIAFPIDVILDHYLAAPHPLS